jgi:5-methylcytosine-specific restriction protein B
MTLDPELARELQRDRERLLADGALRSEPELRRCYATFAARFGPAALRQLDGAELLERMHAHGNRDSLVYWLEFKNDDELPAIFGSIAGGSALKFGVYRRKETGVWMTGSATQQREISLDEAILVARRHRDQLVAAAEALQRFEIRGGGDYDALQAEIDRVAPDLCELSWAHKYLSLLFPDLLDDYHVPEYQRFHLIKLLQTPPPGEGRYRAAGAFVAMGRALGMPMNHLSHVLNERHGRPHAYYRIGTSDQERRSEWPAMLEGGFVSIGWPRLGDLSGVEHDQEGKERVRALLARHYPKDPRILGRTTQQVFKFVATMTIGDLVLAADGGQILGIGRVTGDYQFAPGKNFPHRRPVTWLSTAEWKLPGAEGLQTTVHELRKPEGLIEAERVLLREQAHPRPGPNGSGSDRPPPEPLHGVPARIQEVLERKGQVILYGPPGTGKTHWALVTARELAARSWFGRSWGDLAPSQRDDLRRAVVTCTFHPAYGYEDFLEGFRPTERGGALVFERRDGVFKRLCDEARGREERFFLVIDEINRGDIPRIFGELLTLLEKTRRDEEATLALSGQRFSVPRNVLVIGTMNTADRSIALLDAALRRRFGFVELMPDSAALGDAVIEGIPLGKWLDELNKRVLAHVRRDAKNLQIGHTYLMHEGKPISSLRRLVQVVRDDLIPLLEEYCYEDYEALERILGPSLVQRERRRIDESLFRPAREKELVDALLEPCPDLLTTAKAVASDAAPGADEEDDEVAADGAP